MARKRMIDPAIWQSQDFSRLSMLAKLVFIGLFSNADDEGRGRATAAYVKSMVFPYDGKLRVTDIDKSLDEIAANMSITFYTCDGNEYYSLDNWSKWQKVDKPQPSKLPPVSGDKTGIRERFGEDSANVRGTVPPNRIERNRTEKNIPPLSPLGKQQEEKDLEIFTGELGDAVKDWFAYKTEKRQQYKPTGRKALIATIQKNVTVHGAAAVIGIIRESMSSNYQGIMWDRLDRQKPGAGNAPAKPDYSKDEDFTDFIREDRHECI